MIKKVAGIIMAMAIIVIALVFCGSAILGADTSAVNGTAYEHTVETILTVGNASFNVLLIVPIILMAGALIIVLSLVKSNGSRKRH